MSVRHALLALLTEGPKYGLQLRDEFEARTGEVWSLNVGQVYTTLQRLERDALETLQRLERDALVESEGDGDADTGPQKYFRITPAGRADLESWLHTPSDPTPPRDETGATSHTRRLLTAVTAGALALLGVLLGAAAAYLALVASYLDDLHPLHNVPVAYLAAMAFGVPPLAALAGWLLGGREPPLLTRAVLD